MRATSTDQPTILLCRCQYAGMIPAGVLSATLKHLGEASLSFESVPDLCELSARHAPLLQDYASRGSLRILACSPRAVKWLFAAGNAPLSSETTEVVNLRAQAAELVPATLSVPRLRPNLPAGPALSPGAPSLNSALPLPTADSAPPTGTWKPWFPVIDYDRCTHCLQCLSFCLFGVYGVDANKKIQVQNPAHCKTDCPACSRVCPQAAIMFPKYKAAPINGDEAGDSTAIQEKIRVDISSLLGGDVYAQLRSRQARTQARFSKERDDGQAWAERQKHLRELARDIPPEVLQSLPSPEELAHRAQEAAAKTRALLSHPPSQL